MAVSDADMSLTMERLTRRAEAASLPLVAVRRDPGERDRIEVVVASPQPLPEARSAMLFGRRGLLEFRQVLGEPFKTEAEARAAAAGGDIEVIQDTVEGVYYVCVKAPVLTGAAVRHAAFRMTEEQGPRVLVQFDESGAQTLAAYSREHRNERLAVIFDGTVIMAPVIRDALPPSGIEISGRFSVREGVEMVHLLRFGPPLPLRVEVAEQRTEPGSGVWKPKWIMRDAAFLAGAIVVFVTALIAFIPLGRGEQAAQRALAV